MPVESVSISAALLAGLLSFFSPCVLPLIPAYFTFITGYSLDELTTGRDARFRRKVIQSTISYVFGFSLVFILLGASATLLGSVIYDYREWIRIVGGIMIILFGVHLTGLIRIPGLGFDKRIHVQQKPLHLLGTFLVGMAFGVGWSPCIGPLLGSILIIASNEETVAAGMWLLGIYSLGLALPFLILSVFIHFLLDFLQRAKGFIRYINLIGGLLLILVGTALIANRLVFWG